MKQLWKFTSGYRGRLFASVLFAIAGVVGGMVPCFAVSKIAFIMIEHPTYWQGMAWMVALALLGYTAKILFPSISLMMPDELKSLPKGQFIVMKTGTHPMQTRLRLFLDWGITFDNVYEVPEKAERKVAYADKDELER